MALVALGAAGCGSAASRSAAGSTSPAVAATSPLASAITSQDGAWAVLVMGGSAADENNFWQLFHRPSGSTRWSLVTPPAVADNGGLVAAAETGGLEVAFRPSQDLTFSPLTSTTDNGQHWAPGLLYASIAAVPDALAVQGKTMLALLADGTIDQSATRGATWARLAQARAIATSTAGSRCGVTALTAVSFAPSGSALAGAACAKAGGTGVFVYTDGGWRASGPTLTGSLASQPVRVLRLTSTSAGNTALLMSGTGRHASLYTAWTSDGSHWTLSPAFPTGGGQVKASGTGQGGLTWVLLSDGRAMTINGSGAAWRVLPASPTGTATLAALPGGMVDALVAAGSKLTVFQLSGSTWVDTQVIEVPVQYGSSS